MRSNAKKVSQPAKLKKRPAKTTAKRSKQSLLQSAPAEAPSVVVTERAAPRWLFALAILAALAAILSLIASSGSFRSRTEIQPVTAAVAATNQVLPAVQPVRNEAPAVASAPITDPEVEARYDYMLALATGNTEAIDLFLARHPEGFHADLARAQRKQIVEFELPGIVRRLNAELKRVGCGPTGNTDWTNASQQALASFNRHTQTKFDVKSPNADALKAVKDQTDRVCPQPQPAKAAEAVPQKQTRSLFFWQ
jgi:hypothetical protein